MKPDKLDAKARDYQQRISAGVKEASFERFEQSIRKLDTSDRKFDDAELLKRLEMYAQSGIDRETNPSNLLSCGIPKQELIRQLKRIRSRTLWHLNTHSLEDVHVTNRLINAIQYKPE